MNIQIENYFGHDILKLDYCQLDKVIYKERQKLVETIANKYGFNVADIDEDDNGIEYIRLQQVNVDNSEEQERADLLKLVAKLNTHFL